MKTVLLLALFLYAASAACPDGWEQLGSRCFLFVEGPKNWWDAKDHCNTIGGHLASVTNAQEEVFLQKMMRSHDSRSAAWLGGFVIQGTWMWVGGERFSFTDWYLPHSPIEYPCIALEREHGWTNTLPVSGFPFICSKNANGC